MSQPGAIVPRWSFADRLRKIRRDVVRAATQADMAALLEYPRPAYVNWESGTSRPRDIVEVAQRIERLTGVPASWVLGLEDAPAAVSTKESCSTGARRHRARRGGLTVGARRLPRPGYRAGNWSLDRRRRIAASRRGVTSFVTLSA